MEMFIEMFALVWKMMKRNFLSSGFGTDFGFATCFIVIAAFIDVIRTVNRN
jgi:hypothetical protein